jgi:hypothetical protein
MPWRAWTAELKLFALIPSHFLPVLAVRLVISCWAKKQKASIFMLALL